MAPARREIVIVRLRPSSCAQGAPTRPTRQAVDAAPLRRPIVHRVGTGHDRRGRERWRNRVTIKVQAHYLE